MTIFLVVLVLISLFFDFGINMRESFTKRKRRLYFVISVLVWYSIMGFLIIESTILNPNLQIWYIPESLLIIFGVVIYFLIHFWRGLTIYNSEPEKKEN
ncbi:MAG: hypothetical protein WC895_01525 [Candidatus Shapirobacteria bacterium]|jgi:predicted membrane channel-forming protein YqfA (hemolysin III family)